MGFLHHFPLQIYTEGLLSFGAFNKCFCKNSFASLPMYKEAIFQIIEVRDENVTKSKHVSPNTILQRLFFRSTIFSVPFLFLYVLLATFSLPSNVTHSLLHNVLPLVMIKFRKLQPNFRLWSCNSVGCLP